MLAERIADNINLKIDLPFRNEEQERGIFLWIVNLILRVVPESLHGVFEDASDGLSDEEIERYSNEAAVLIAAQFDVPWVPERAEVMAVGRVLDSLIGWIKASIVPRVVGQVFEFARPGNSLQTTAV